MVHNESLKPPCETPSYGDPTIYLLFLQYHSTGHHFNLPDTPETPREGEEAAAPLEHTVGLDPIHPVDEKGSIVQPNNICQQILLARE